MKQDLGLRQQANEIKADHTKLMGYEVRYDSDPHVAERRGIKDWPLPKMLAFQIPQGSLRLLVSSGTTRTPHCVFLETNSPFTLRQDLVLII
jgi:hypothetical protein